MTLSRKSPVPETTQIRGQLARWAAQQTPHLPVPGLLAPGVDMGSCSQYLGLVQGQDLRGCWPQAAVLPWPLREP